MAEAPSVEPPGEVMRLFVALRLDPELHAAMARFQAGLRALDPERRVRWVEPGGIHLTLKFLGEVRDEVVPRLVERLDSAVQGRRAPRLRLGSPGTFPNARRPRVLWLGLAEEGADSRELSLLQSGVEDAASSLGWEPEKRPFQPHLTLGRVKEGPASHPVDLPRALTEALAATAPPQAEARPQRRISLMRSHLHPAGARYEEIQGWDLE